MSQKHIDLKIKMVDLKIKIKEYNKLLLKWQLMKKDSNNQRIAANAIAKRILLLELEINKVTLK